MASGPLRQESYRMLSQRSLFRSASANTINKEDHVSLLERWQDDILPHALKIVGCVIFYIICVWYYHANLGWSIVKCIYFVTVSITTVGYGDLTPETNEQRVFTIFMLLVGLIAVFSTINDFANSIIVKAERKALERLEDDSSDNTGVRYTWRIILSILFILICLATGTVFFIFNEDWDFVEALYFSVVTTVSVGYGDRVLKHESSRIFLIFYISISVIVVAGAIGNFGSVKMEIAFENKKIALLKKELDMDAIKQMDQDGHGVGKVEFLTAMLVQMNGLSKEKDIDPWLKRFEELDADGSGFLDQEDIKLFAKEQKRDIKMRLRKLTKRNIYSSESSDFDVGASDNITDSVIRESNTDNSSPVVVNMIELSETSDTQEIY